jgi:hypothetical protein
MSPARSSAHLRWLGAALLALAAHGVAIAQAAPVGTSIYTCVNAKGQNLRSDRPIAECNDREQRVLNRDGSFQRMLPPMLTIEERSQREAAERIAAAEKAARREAERSDRLLMQRYPSETSHTKAREAALDTVRYAIKQSELRLKDLDKERKPLLEEAEFYKNRPLPPKLKQQFDAFEATAEAQRLLMLNQQAEMQRINAVYDTELARLRLLWAGAQPGTLGPMSAPTQQLPQANVTPIVAKSVSTQRQ